MASFASRRFRRRAYIPAARPSASRCRRELHHGVLAWAGAILLAGCLPLAGARAQTCTAPPADAVYWLAADNSLDDLAGAHNGVDGSGTTFVPGKVGGALHFEDDSNLGTSTATEEERALRTAFTIELWARPERTLGNCPESNSNNCGTGLPWAVFPEHGDTSAPPGEEGLAAGIGLAIGTNGVCAGQHAPWLATCLARIDAPIVGWTHVAVVVEDRTPRIYLDGTLVRNGVMSTKDFVFASWRMFGHTGLGDYRGDLDEVTVYARALSDAEIAAIAAAGGAGKCRPACNAGREDDAWQGASVTAHSPIESEFPDAVFGGDGGDPEPDALIFTGAQAGAVHTLEWQARTPVTIERLGILARHDSSLDDYRHGLRRITIQARTSGGSYVPIYTSRIAVPYGQGSDGSTLELCPRIRPVTAQEFRAEVEQAGDATASGPRLLALDALLIDRIFADGFEAQP